MQLDLDFDKRFGSERVGAYERLLLDVIDGRLNLFVRSDEQEEAWRWVEPILDSWSNESSAPTLSAVAGPQAASAMMRPASAGEECSPPPGCWVGIMRSRDCFAPRDAAPLV